MQYMTAKEAAEKWNISQRRVAVLCAENRIENAEMLGNMWLIPKDAEKPQDARSLRYFENKKINGVAKWLDTKVEKHKGQIEKYGYWGLVLFVGIPLPGTGAWTGCLIASVLEMDKKKSFLAALLGVFIASIIMMLLSFGLLSNII